MKMLNTLSATDNPSVMLFGAPFTGKSLLASKLAEHFKLIYIDMENGKDVMFQLPEEWQKRIQLISLPDTSAWPIAIETCLKLVKIPVSICDEHGKIGCLSCKKAELGLIDEIGKEAAHDEYFSDIDLNNVDENTIVIFDSATQLTSSAISHITRKQSDDYKLEFDDWGSLAKLMDIFFSHIQNARYKRIVISHLVETKGDDKKALIFPVAGSKNFSSNVCKFFDNVVYLELKNNKHKAGSTTTYANNVMTGSRAGVALEDMDEATLLSIFKPEAVKKQAAVKTVTSSSVKAGTGSSSSILEKLKAKNSSS